MDFSNTRLRLSAGFSFSYFNAEKNNKCNLPAAKSILSNGILIINLCFALSIYCLPDGEFLKQSKNPFQCNRNAPSYTITAVGGFFVNVAVLRLQLVIITRSLKRKIHRSFFIPDVD